MWPPTIYRNIGNTGLTRIHHQTMRYIVGMIGIGRSQAAEWLWIMAYPFWRRHIMITWYGHPHVHGCSSQKCAINRKQLVVLQLSWFRGPGNSNSPQDNGVLADSGWKLKSASTTMTALEHSRQTSLVNAQLCNVLFTSLHWCHIKQFVRDDDRDVTCLIFADIVWTHFRVCQPKWRWYNGNMKDFIKGRWRTVVIYSTCVETVDV